MPFSSMQKDIVHIQRADGTKAGPYKTALSSTSATIFDKSLDVTEGEHLVRVLPNGKEESYLILSAAYSAGLTGIPPHYTLTLEKSTSLLSKPAARHTTININHSSGIQVGDHNAMNIQNALNELIQKIEQSDASEVTKAEAKNKVSALLAHPLVSSVVGGIVSGVAGATK